MKKTTIILMAFVMPLLLFSCHAKKEVQPTQPKAERVKPNVVKAIPATYTEFEELYNKIGNTPEGCVTLQLVAMEMYRQNSGIGTRCLKLINTDSSFNSMMRRLPEIFREGDSYARPYLVASYFEGASPENGYNPTKPYVVTVRKNPNQRSQYSEMLEGTTYPMQVYCYGADTPWRGITLIMLDGEDHYLVHEGTGLTPQCKQIRRGQTFNGL